MYGAKIGIFAEKLPVTKYRFSITIYPAMANWILFDSLLSCDLGNEEK
jgi:hypothetical protein